MNDEIRDAQLKSLEENLRVISQDIGIKLKQLSLRMDALQRQIAEVRDR